MTYVLFYSEGRGEHILQVARAEAESTIGARGGDGQV